MDKEALFRGRVRPFDFAQGRLRAKRQNVGTDWDGPGIAWDVAVGTGVGTGRDEVGTGGDECDFYHRGLRGNGGRQIKSGDLAIG